MRGRVGPRKFAFPGVAATGVAAVAKHFVANTQENFRILVDARISRRALHEVYYPPWRAAVRAGIDDGSIKATAQLCVRLTHATDLKRTADAYYGGRVRVACYNQKKRDKSTTQHLKYEKHIIISPETASFDVLGDNLERFDGGVLILDEVHSLA